MKKPGKFIRLLSILLIPLPLLYVFASGFMAQIGKFLVRSDEPVHSDAVVVLYTGVEYYERLVQAASIYREGFADKVVINGNRKSAVLRELEKKGLQSCCPWYEESLRILELLGVAREDVISVSAEDVYDTVSEAEAVGEVLLKQGVSSIIITTSKSHTRRAHYIWAHLFMDRLTVRTVAARDDPFSPENWWKDGRQIRWVLAEYGAWGYYAWKASVRSL